MLRRTAILTVAVAALGLSIACAGGDPLTRLMEQARLGDPEVQMTYTENQAAIEDPESIPALVDYLTNDPSSDVRQWSALILGRIGDAQAVPGLTTALSDDDTEVRGRAVAALQLIGEADAEGAFIEVLSSGSRQARITALVELEKSGSVAAIPAISETARSDDDLVSGSAVNTLGGISDPAAAAALVSLAMDAGLSEDVRRSAIMNLGRMSTMESSAGLQEIIDGLSSQEGAEELVQLARDQG